MATCISFVALAMQVLDRVVGRVGGPKWWNTLSLRAKAQRMHQSRRQGAPVVSGSVAGSRMDGPRHRIQSRAAADDLLKAIK